MPSGRAFRYGRRTMTSSHIKREDTETVMKKTSILALVLAVVMIAAVAWAIGVGSTVGNVQMRNSNNQPAWIPDLGSKVVTVFYNDSSAADFTDPIATAIKNKNYPESKYRGQGIANMADSRGIPDFVIRGIVRSKERKYDTKILTDPDHILRNAWNLGNCNDIGVVIVIGKDKVVRYLGRITSVAQGQAQVSKVVSIVESEMAKLK